MYTHAILRNSAPKWQPLSGISGGIMGKCQSESVLADDSGNGDRQLWKGSGSGARLPAVGTSGGSGRKQQSLYEPRLKIMFFFVILSPF